MAGLASVKVGTLIGARYEVVSKLGGGTSGDVYRVLDKHLNTEVAIKLLKPVSGQPATWDEAQALKRLGSEYLLRVFNADVIEGSDIRYITTPLMTGGDLEKAARPHGVDAITALRWAQQAGHGLERIHAEGMLHRDVKPGNIFLDSAGDALLGDLGLTVHADAHGRAAAMGTFATVAPELLGGALCSISTDVYSLAATTFFLLSGHYPSGPFSLDPTARRDRIVQASFDKLRDAAPHVPQKLVAVVERSLSADPDLRATSARQFANALADCRHRGRAWQRVPSHPGHDCCFRGGATGNAKPVNLCVVPEPKGHFGIEVILDSGTHAKRHESHGLTRSRLRQVVQQKFRSV